jgi:hypothetical protein
MVVAVFKPKGALIIFLWFRQRNYGGEPMILRKPCG